MRERVNPNLSYLFSNLRCSDKHSVLTLSMLTSLEWTCPTLYLKESIVTPGIIKMKMMSWAVTTIETGRFLTPLKQTTFENVVAKGEMTHNEPFLLSPQYFHLYLIIILSLKLFQSIV